MIAILDLRIGNLSSVRTGFARAGAETAVIESAKDWHGLLEREGQRISGVVLPGVGAFGDAMFHLRASGLIPIIRQIAREGRPLLGICLGMQLLFGESFEHGRTIGLGLLPGQVVRFRDDAVKVPHMGWNSLDTVDLTHPLLQNVAIGEYVYFVHSYYVEAAEAKDVLASTTYGSVRVPAVVGRQMMMGAQFHPEKSGAVGEQILRNFAKICADWTVAAKPSAEVQL